MPNTINMKIRALIKSAFLIALLAIASGASAAALQQELAEAGVKARFSASTNEFSLAGTPIFLELELESTKVCTVTPPSDITPYLDGFELESSFSEEIGTNGLARCYHYKLIPIADPQYSAAERTIYPIAISVLDSSFSPAKEKYIFLKQFTFNLEKLDEELEVTNAVDPIYVKYNHWITIEYIGYGLLVVIALALLYWLFRFLRYKHKLRRMTPKERALHELDLLISKQLIDKGCIKDFYIELTHVVRRYIERKYGIKAPERTTEEFIAEAIALDNFPKQYIPELKQFLASADMVKFAKQEATKATADSATAAARNYIEVDSALEYDEAKPQEEGK